MEEGDLALVRASRERRKMSVAGPLGLAEEEEGGRVVGRMERGRRFRIEGGRARTGKNEREEEGGKKGSSTDRRRRTLVSFL